MINSIVFSEIIDNNFLDKSSKDGIISLVQFEKDETPSLEFEKYESLIESKYQESYLTKFAQLLIPLAASATIGLLASKIFIEQGVKEFLNGNSAQILENLAITLTVVAILAVVYSIRQRRYLSKNFIQVEGRGDE